MKIDIISDLHIDFAVRETNPQNPKMKKQLDKFIESIKPNYHDVLIIAGDLGHYYHQDTQFLLMMKEYYTDIIIVPGNHDMYLVSNKIQKEYQFDSWNRVLEMKYFCRDNDIHYLDGNVINIKGINFGGCGMAWDMSYANTLYDDVTRSEVREHWKNIMNDSNLMFGGKDNVKITLAYGSYYTEPSFDPFEFFESQYEKLQKVDKADVMVTHYGPSIPEKLREDYKNMTTTFYYFDGSEDIARLNPKYWVYGHTHDKYSDMVGKTNVLSNPLGYPGENTKTIMKTLEIKDVK